MTNIPMREQAADFIDITDILNSSPNIQEIELLTQIGTSTLTEAQCEQIIASEPHVLCVKEVSLLTQDGESQDNAESPIPSLKGLSVPAEELEEILKPLLRNLDRKLYFDDIVDHVLNRRPWKMKLGERSPSAQKHYKKTNALSANALELMLLPVLTLANDVRLSESQRKQLDDTAGKTENNANTLMEKLLAIEKSRINLTEKYSAKSTLLPAKLRTIIALEADGIDNLNDLEKGRSYRTAQKIKVESLRIINEVVQILTPEEQQL